MDFLRLNIKHLRTLRGLTQPQLGEILGVSRDNIASYERGTMPPVEIIHKIVTHFHVDFLDLVEKDLSTYEAKNVSGPIVSTERRIYSAPTRKASMMVANDSEEPSQIKRPDLERVISAQEMTIASQQQTIEALRLYIDSQRKPDDSKKREESKPKREDRPAYLPE
jgi:transcriptional regulator with XRE-family HTH domain